MKNLLFGLGIGFIMGVSLLAITKSNDAEIIYIPTNDYQIELFDSTFSVLDNNRLVGILPLDSSKISQLFLTDNE